MSVKPDYLLSADHIHYGWNNTIKPVATVTSGNIVEFETVDASGGQISASSNLEDVAKLDFSKVNPITGPVYVKDAEPGDVLRVSILSISPSGWGWTAVIPGFGLLADRFKEPALYIWEYDPKSLTPAQYSKGVKVPLKLFPGTIGVAPGTEGDHSVVNPRRVGGNMDTRDMGVGSVLYLPVEVPGALFSVGDGHAGQGDGEICGTAIESSMNVTVKLEVVKNMQLNFPRLSTPGPVTRHLDSDGYEVTTGIGPDLLQSAKTAVSDMVDFISHNRDLSPTEAYMLCSVCADLRINEIVDAPDWIVSCYFPKVVFS